MAVSILVCQVCQPAAHVASLIISSDIYIAQMEPHNLYHLSCNSYSTQEVNRPFSPSANVGWVYISSRSAM